MIGTFPGYLYFKQSSHYSKMEKTTEFLVEHGYYYLLYQEVGKLFCGIKAIVISVFETKTNTQQLVKLYGRPTSELCNMQCNTLRN